MANRWYRDEAVDLVAYGLAGGSARPIQTCSLFEICEALEPQDWQAHELGSYLVDAGVRSACQYFHEDHLSYCDVRATIDQSLEGGHRGVASSAEQLDPHRSVDDDHRRG